MSEVTVIGEEIHIAVDDPAPAISLTVANPADPIVVEVGTPGDTGPVGPAGSAYVKNVIDANFTVPTGHTAIRGRTAVNSGIVVTVEPSAVLKLI